MTMEQTAKLGIFIIKFIDDMELDKSVGFSKECHPQVVYIPDILLPEGFPEQPPPNISKEELEELQKKYFELSLQYPIKELPKNEVNHLINEISSKVSDFENLFKQGQFKI